MKIRIALFALLSMLSTSFAFAAATVQSVSGDANVEVAGTTSKLSVGEKIESGSTIQTGKDGRVMLRFDDGQMTALSSETTFRIDNYRYNPAKPAKGNIAVSLLKGALRMVTGLIGKFNHSAFKLDTPVATIGIRGTDFMVGAYDDPAGVDPIAIQTIYGQVTVTNAVGTSLVQPPGIVMVGGPFATPVTISLAQLPANISNALTQLMNANMTAAAGVQGSTGGTGGASGASQAASGAGLSSGAVAGLVAAGVAAAAASNNNSTVSTTATQ